MEKQLEAIRDLQKSTWNEFSPMWKKWADILMDAAMPLTTTFIELLNLKESDRVLDLASGTGEPGLTMAAHVKKGQIVLTDLSDGMLGVARENAKQKGIDNIDIQVCDACDLPFADNSFDAASCRLGFMFFPDMLLAAKEIYRVLKPGGKLAIAVWNIPEKNNWATTISGVIMKNLQLTPPPPNAPGLFRCAQPRQMKDLFQEAGFKNTLEKEIAVEVKFSTPERYWTIITEVTPPLVAALKNVDTSTKDKIRTEVLQIVTEQYPDGVVNIEGSTLVIAGEK